MSLWRYVVGRLAQSAVLVLLVITLAFFVIQLAPGDPVLYLYGAQHVSPRPWMASGANGVSTGPSGSSTRRYLGNLLRGDLGFSHVNQQPVGAHAPRSIPNTLLLLVPSLILAATIGILLGTEASAG